MAALFEIIQDRTIRPIVTVTTVREMLESPTHPIKHGNSVSQLGSTGQGK